MIAVTATACVGVSQAFVAPMAGVSAAAHVRPASPLTMAAAENSYHKKDFWIAPSILSADMAKLGEEVDNAMAAGADIVHFDVMDNHYVPNLTIGPLVCKGLRDHGVTQPIDVHLMVSPVDRIVGDFADAGASFITFHPEASPHVDRTLQLIKSHGCKAGGLSFWFFTYTQQPVSAKRLSYSSVLLSSLFPFFDGSIELRTYNHSSGRPSLMLTLQLLCFAAGYIGVLFVTTGLAFNKGGTLLCSG